MAKTMQRSRGVVVPFKPMVHWKSDEDMLEAVEKAKGELRLEGLELDEEQTQLLLKDAREGWSDEEFTRRLLELIQKRRGARS